MTTAIEGWGPSSTRGPGSGSADPERGLVERAQRGDLEAFEQVIGLHVRRLRTLLALRAPAAHLIDELCHETLVFAYRNLADFSAGTDFGAWLRAIANNLLRAEIQRFSREQLNRTRLAEHLMVEVSRKEQDEGRDDQAVEALERCMEKIPEDLRQLIDLKYRRNLSAQEIAEACGRSVPWVRTTLFRLRQKLKECIEGRLSAEGRA